MRTAIATLAVAALVAGGCGGKSASGRMVWCAAPGEVVDARFKAEYPDLYITKAECDEANR